MQSILYQSVIVNYWLLPVALLVLWVPRQWLRYGGKLISIPQPRRPGRDERDSRDESLKFSAAFAKPRNWVDFLRALGGGLAICYMCFEPAPDAPRAVDTQIFVVQCVILGLAILIQTIRIENRLTLVAPIFFLMGLSFGLVGWKAALFACVAIWTINLVLPSVSVFLVVFGALQLCFGLLFGSRLSLPASILAASLAMAPVLLSGITKRRLVQLNKKSRGARD